MSTMIGYSGSLSLRDLQDQIQFQESGGLALKACHAVTGNEGHPINVFEFEETSDDMAPPDITLLPASAQPAPKLAKVLTGTVIVSGNFTQVNFYR